MEVTRSVMSPENPISPGEDHDLYVNLLHRFSFEILDKSIKLVDLVLSVIGLFLPPETTVEVNREMADGYRGSVVFSDALSVVSCGNL